LPVPWGWMREIPNFAGGQDTRNCLLGLAASAHGHHLLQQYRRRDSMAAQQVASEETDCRRSNTNRPRA
jgi:hypothetical protein